MESKFTVAHIAFDELIGWPLENSFHGITWRNHDKPFLLVKGNSVMKICIIKIH